MEKFNSTQETLAAEVAHDSAEAPSSRVMKGEAPAQRLVSQFKFGKIAKPGDGNYEQLKARVGSLAVTDEDRKPRPRKDSRFEMSSYTKERLAIEDEERRAVDELVNRRLAEERVIVYEEAKRIAHTEGFAAGRAEALEHFHTESKAKLVELDTIVNSFEAIRLELYEAHEKFLLDLICRISRMVLLRELKVDREFLKRLTRNLVERVGVRENIRIRIAPEDADLLRDLRADLEKYFGNLQNLQLEASSLVQSGGCLLETSWNAIDATIDTQFRGIYDSLLGEVPPGRGGVEAVSRGQEVELDAGDSGSDGDNSGSNGGGAQSA